jgi:hypothetical protein
VPFFESKGRALPSLLDIMSIEFSTWLLGLGGYAGLFGALAVFYLYPTFPRNYLPVLFVVPLISAAGLYTFFQALYLFLWFTVKVLEAMLNEHLTIILLSTTFIGGQAVLIGYVVYKNAFVNNIVLNNAAYEEEEAGEELQPEEYEEPAADEEDEEDSGADADNEEGILNSATVTTNTPATTAPVIYATCVDCDDNCTKCMPGLISLPGLISFDKLTGLSGETTAGIVCEGGVCLIDSTVAAAANATIKNMMEEFAEDVKID